MTEKAWYWCQQNSPTHSNIVITKCLIEGAYNKYQRQSIKANRNCERIAKKSFSSKDGLSRVFIFIVTS